MTVIQTNLDSLRAYPIAEMDGSIAHDNVEKLRLFTLSTADIRRQFLLVSLNYQHLTAQQLSRPAIRKFSAAVQIP